MDCTVIIPVGPGHHESYKQAVESVRMATLDKGPFEKVNIKIVDDTDGEMGRSKARNEGVKSVDTEWMFFLDADDLMHPNAFASFATCSDYDAVFGQILEYDAGCVKQRYQVPHIRNRKELLSFHPYLTLQMGHFVRKECFIPFDEDMNTGEDWKYYLELWDKHNCRKVNLPFMINVRGNHSVGPKSATGGEWTETVLKLMEEARAKEQENA